MPYKKTYRKKTFRKKRRYNFVKKRKNFKRKFNTKTRTQTQMYKGLYP